VFSQGRFDAELVDDKGRSQATCQAVGGARVALAQVGQDRIQGGFSRWSGLTPGSLKLLGSPTPLLALQMGYHALAYRRLAVSYKRRSIPPKLYRVVEGEATVRNYEANAFADGLKQTSAYQCLAGRALLNGKDLLVSLYIDANSDRGPFLLP
jgi:hypothetical protein